MSVIADCVCRCIVRFRLWQMEMSTMKGVDTHFDADGISS